jgi:hypothetical protein
MVVFGGGAVAKIGPVGESRWISTGAPCAKPLPTTVTVPPGCTDDDRVVSENTATHAQMALTAITAITVTASAELRTSRRQYVLIRRIPTMVIPSPSVMVARISPTT